MGADGILRAEISGMLGPGILDGFQRELALFLDAATPERPLTGILYTRELEHLSPTLRNRLTEVHCDPRVRKIAMVNPSREMRVLNRFIMHAAGGERSAAFSNEADAVTWLKEQMS
jgi:hypothetical protein